MLVSELHAGAMPGADREPLLCLSLAGRTPEPDSLLAWAALLGPADRGPAAPARPARAAVHPVLFAAPGHARGDDAEPFLVGIQQSVAEFYKGTQVRYLSDRPPRAEAPEEQHFCSKNIADPGEVALVEQGLADRAGRVGAQAAFGLGRVPVRAEQVRAEVTDHGVLAGRGQDLHDAQLVAHRLPFAVRQDQPDPV